MRRSLDVILMVAVAALLTGLLVGPGPAEAAFPGTNGKIAYERLDADFDVYAVDPAGTGATDLTFDPSRFSDDFSPAWSPDGTKIAFHATREGNFDAGYDIYVMNANGTGQTRLTAGSENDYDPAWSPDGSKLAFTRCCPGGNAEIYVMNADGSGQTNLTNASSWDRTPAWSPEGSKIAFDSNRVDPDAEEIYVMNADGSAQTDLSNNPAQDYSPAWSPDGSKLAFVSDRDDWNNEIYVMNSDGTGQARLTVRPGVDGAPAWSPDGTKIAFQGYEAGNPEILVMNADGTGQVNLTNSPASERRPDWQPLASPPAGAVITGAVRKRDGGVIAGARVSWTGPKNGTTLTGSNGRYRMSSSSGGTYSLTASASGCRQRSTSVTLAPRTTTRLDFALRC
jgi:Tol biopolymer transport system component